MLLFDEMPEADIPNLKGLVPAGNKKAVFDYLRNLNKNELVEEVSLAGFSLISYQHGKMAVIEYVMRQM